MGFPKRLSAVDPRRTFFLSDRGDADSILTFEIFKDIKERLLIDIFLSCQHITSSSDKKHPDFVVRNTISTYH